MKELLERVSPAFGCAVRPQIAEHCIATEPAFARCCQQCKQSEAPSLMRKSTCCSAAQVQLAKRFKAIRRRELTPGQF